MAICGTCGAEGARVRSRWLGTVQQPDECPECAPQTFERVQMPSDKKIWMGYEAHPNEYVKAEDGGYDRKPEYRAEMEQKLHNISEDEAELQRIAIEDKRATRRTEPMTASETLAALNKARIIADAMEQCNAEAERQTQQAALDSWVAKAKQA